jgi:hypothetical protein
LLRGAASGACGSGLLPLLGGALCLITGGATLIEAFHTACSVYNALLTGVERMTVGAQIDADSRHCRMCMDFGATRRAGNNRLHVIRMNAFFHDLLSFDRNVHEELHSGHFYID